MKHRQPFGMTDQLRVKGQRLSSSFILPPSSFSHEAASDLDRQDPGRAFAGAD